MHAVLRIGLRKSSFRSTWERIFFVVTKKMLNALSEKIQALEERLGVSPVYRGSKTSMWNLQSRLDQVYNALYRGKQLGIDAEGLEKIERKGYYPNQELAKEAIEMFESIRPKGDIRPTYKYYCTFIEPEMIDDLRESQIKALVSINGYNTTLVGGITGESLDRHNRVLTYLQDNPNVFAVNVSSNALSSNDLRTPQHSDWFRPYDYLYSRIKMVADNLPVKLKDMTSNVKFASDYIRSFPTLFQAFKDNPFFTVDGKNRIVPANAVEEGQSVQDIRHNVDQVIHEIMNGVFTENATLETDFKRDKRQADSVMAKPPLYNDALGVIFLYTIHLGAIWENIKSIKDWTVGTSVGEYLLSKHDGGESIIDQLMKNEHTSKIPKLEMHIDGEKDDILAVLYAASVCESVDVYIHRGNGTVLTDGDISGLCDKLNAFPNVKVIKVETHRKPETQAIS